MEDQVEVDPDELNSHKTAMLNMEMVCERLPEHLRNEGPSTAKEAGVAVTEYTPEEHPTRDGTELLLQVTDKVKRALETLEDAGYVVKSRNEKGQYEWAWNPTE